MICAASKESVIWPSIGMASKVRVYGGVERNDSEPANVVKPSRECGKMTPDSVE